VRVSRAVHTIRDVARTAGVSIATVSRVLNESARVSKHTQAQVRRAITILEYEPDQAARQLSMRKQIMRGNVVAEPRHAN
jgi:LacI family transcriptional regulator